MSTPQLLGKSPQYGLPDYSFVVSELILQGMRKQWVQNIVHVVGWVFFYLLPYLLFFKGLPNIHTMFSDSGDVVHLLSFSLLICFSYLNYYKLVPGLYLGRSYVWYFLVVLVSLFVIIRVPLLLEPHAPGFVHRPPGAGPPLFFGMNYTIILFLVSVFLSVLVRLRLQLMQVEQEKLNAELSFLKAQINPHFLFNTLNSIYSLAIQKSDKTADAVVQLSNLMRYVIKDTHGKDVELAKEIDYITNYINLQKSRLGDTVQVAYGVQGTPDGYRIAPLILISFVENAFKHGVNPDENSSLRITITVANQQLSLQVINNKVRSVQHEEFSGIGLANTRERLEHLYPGGHTLTIREDEHTFCVNLTITLT